MKKLVNQKVVAATLALAYIPFGMAACQPQKPAQPTLEQITVAADGKETVSSATTSASTLATSSGEASVEPTSEQQVIFGQNVISPTAQILQTATFETIELNAHIADQDEHNLFNKSGCGITVAFTDADNHYLDFAERHLELPDFPGKTLDFVDVEKASAVNAGLNKANDLTDLSDAKGNPVLYRIFRLSPDFDLSLLSQYFWNKGAGLKYHVFANAAGAALVIEAAPQTANLFDSHAYDLTINRLGESLSFASLDFKPDSAIYLGEKVAQALPEAVYQRLGIPSQFLFTDGQTRELNFVPKSLAPIQLPVITADLTLPLTSTLGLNHKEKHLANKFDHLQAKKELLAKKGVPTQGLEKQQQQLKLAEERIKSQLKNKVSQALDGLEFAYLPETNSLLALLHYDGEQPVLKGEVAGKIYQFLGGGTKDAKEKTYGVPSVAIEKLQTFMQAELEQAGIAASAKVILLVDQKTASKLGEKDFKEVEIPEYAGTYYRVLA